MPELTRLTKRAVDAVPFQPKGKPPAFYRDGELTGFGLKVTSERKIFIVERRVNGKPKRITIGAYGPWTPDNARTEAQKLLAEMAGGRDPLQKKREARQHRVTLREALDAYLQGRELSPKTVTEYQRVGVLYLNDWADKPITQISREKVSQRFQSLTSNNGAATANAVMRVLKAVLNFAQHQYGTEEHPLFINNPVQILSQTRVWNRIPRRQGHLGPADLGPWFRAVQDLPNPVLRDYLLFLLFTGMRREEAAGLRWSQVDFANHLLTVTQTKNHDPLALPLSSFLYGLLQQRQVQANPDSPYVFPGNGQTGYIQEPRKALEAVGRQTGILITPHDLRRTFITVADSLEISPYAVKRLVNHRQDRGDVTAGYIITDVERLREPMERISQKILERVEEG
ncbi:tyrosine-type recombinase/integrase [Acidithiobacillus sp. IBUN Pt1247-S3]|uniref:tyrosine-type recombinase/integrase n=1 Tax=Acidithiobacillus sp. IBUN Pt1247-S3 TaxID=3166642 RepID=UPI0034E56BC8